MPRRTERSRWLLNAGGFALTACLLGGCKGTTPVDTADLHTPAGFLQLQSTSGLTLVANFGTMAVHLIQPAASSDVAGGLPAPLPRFSQFYVSAVSSVGTETVLSNTLSADKLDARGRSADPVLSRMPPASDVTVRIYLLAEDGRLVASGEVQHTTIRPGPNTVDIAMVADTLPPQLLGASDSINVSDNVIVKGATMDVTTGVLNAAPGVARVEVEVTGEAYGDGKESAQIAALTAPGLDQYQWRPIDASGEYDPSQLAAGNTKAPFSLITKAYDPFDHLVGTGKLDLSVIGTAFVDVGVGAN